MFGEVVARISQLIGAAALLLIGAAAQAAPDYVTAIWKVQSLDFAYHGTTTAYSCSTLQRRMETILRTLGARDTLSVVMQRCTDQADAHMRITLASPVEASEANIQAATEHNSTDALIARVRNESLPSAVTIERFPAVWKTVSMSRDQELKLESGDCELVKQLRRDVFPRLAIRIVRDNLRCSTAFPNLGQPQLTVAALVAAPTPN
jgi:hypothetical protein